MTPIRLVAIGFIFLCTAVAWMVLGSTVTARSGEADGSLRAEVEQLWGGEHLQRAPVAALAQHAERHPEEPVDVDTLAAAVTQAASAVRARRTAPSR